MADTTLYKQIVLEWGQDTDSLIWGMGYSPDNGEHFYVLNTTYGRKYRTEDGDRIWPFIVDKVKAVLDWSNISGKPDVATKADVSSALTVANTAKSTADSALSKANSNAATLNNKLSPDGQFLFNENDGDNMWALIKPKIVTITDPFAVTIVQSGTYDGLTTSGYYEIRTSSVTGGPSTETGVLKVIDANGNIITQTMHTVSDAVWIRNKHNDAWTAWRKATFLS
ncbi:hypothetical protein HCY88_04250 [Limosilactobacillus fermentum]